MHYIKFTSFVLLLMVLYRCTEPYSPNLDTTYTRLAVEAYLTDTEDKQYIHLAYSADYLANIPPEPVNNAMVRVFVMSKVDSVVLDTIFYEEEAASGYYLPPQGFKGTPGFLYKMLVENVDMDKDGTTEQYSAIDYMPFPIEEDKIDSIGLSYYSNSQFDFWQMRLWAVEPRGPNWYVFHKFKNGKALSDSIDLFNATDDMLVQDTLRGIGVQNLDNYDSIEWPELLDTFDLEMWNISEDYYDFITQVQQVISYQNPLFSGPPANVHTNLSDGAVGFFATYSTNREQTIVKFIPQEAIRRREEAQ